MTRKSFAAIKSAQDIIPKIQALAASGAEDALEKIQALAAKWNHDFADCDPYWKPDASANASQPRENAIALGAFIQR